MKNLYLLLFISFTYCLTAQEYLPTTNPSHQWKVYFEPSIMVAPECHNISLNYIYSIGNEISMNGFTYRELLRTYDENSIENLIIIENFCPDEFYFQSNLNGFTSIIGYLRDDLESKKVYFLGYNDTNEYVIYNFVYTPGTYNLGDETLVVTDNINVFGINTVRQNYIYQGETYRTVYESIGNTSDLLISWYLNSGFENGGYKLLGFSNDNGLTFYDINNNILSTNDPSLNNSVKIYPNPVNDIINLQTEKKIKSVVIYDLSGGKVKESNSSNKISVKGLNPATYIITLEFEDGSAYRNKFIKN